MIKRRATVKRSTKKRRRNPLDIRGSRRQAGSLQDARLRIVAWLGESDGSIIRYLRYDDDNAYQHDITEQAEIAAVTVGGRACILITPVGNYRLWEEFEDE